MRKNIKAAAFAVVLFFIFLSPLFAKGKTEEQAVKLVNKEYILCITSFNVSALPAGLQVLGPILQREIASDLTRIHHRIRSENEVSRYEQLAWMEAIHATANEIAKKREDRDNLLFRGYPNWKYKKEIKRINKDIKTLEEKYTAARDEKPVVEEQPLFKLLAGNAARPATFPQAPEKGKEEAFLRSNKADAFLEGKFRIFYGRIYVEFRLFTRGASFVYEDSFIFSSENLNSAADEIKHRFLGALINSSLIRLALNVDPEDSQIEVNGKIVKKGQILELPPGPVTITVSAAGYQGLKEELLLEGGEKEVSYELTPLEKEKLRIMFPGPNSSVYSGAMYMGGNPVPKIEETDSGDEDIEIPDGEIAETDETEEHIAEADETEEQITEIEETTAEIAETAETAEEIAETAETAEEIAETAETAEEIADADETAADIEETDDIIITEEEIEDENTRIARETQAGFFSIYIPMGHYHYIRVETEDGLTGEAIVKGKEDAKDVRIITLKPRKLPGKDDNPVEKSRKKFYGAYGRFWVALPLAFIINGISANFADSYNSTGNPEMYTNAQYTNYASIGAWVITGAFLAETLIRMFIYVRTGTKESIQYIE